MKNAYMADVGSCWLTACTGYKSFSLLRKTSRSLDEYLTLFDSTEFKSCRNGTLRWRLINTAAIINAWAVHELQLGWICGIGVVLKVRSWRQIGF